MAHLLKGSVGARGTGAGRLGRRSNTRRQARRWLLVWSRPRLPPGGAGPCRVPAPGCSAGLRPVGPP